MHVLFVLGVSVLSYSLDLHLSEYLIGWFNRGREIRWKFYLIGQVQAEAGCTMQMAIALKLFGRCGLMVWCDEIIRIYDPHPPLCRLNPRRKNKFPFILSTRAEQLVSGGGGSLSINLFNETRITILGIQNILDGFQIKLLTIWVWLKAWTKLLSSPKSI